MLSAQFHHSSRREWLMRGHPPAQNYKPFDKLSAHPNWHWFWAIALAAIAFAFRLVPVLRGGGLFGLGNYDDGVYYAAATGLVHGRLPYRTSCCSIRQACRCC